MGLSFITSKMHYLFLIIALLLNASANILMKVGATKMGSFKSLSFSQITLKLVTNYFLILGLIFFALNVIFYFLSLTKINLSAAYPIMTSGGFLIISLVSILYLRESLTSLQIIGIILIAIGITFIAYHLK